MLHEDSQIQVLNELALSRLRTTRSGRRGHVVGDGAKAQERGPTAVSGGAYASMNAVEPELALSPAAERMRRHRKRRRNRLRYIGIELRETEIARLVSLGFLRPDDHQDRAAIKRAFYLYLDRTLGAVP